MGDCVQEDSDAQATASWTTLPTGYATDIRHVTVFCGDSLPL
jgi:hypothetical protein